MKSKLIRLFSKYNDIGHDAETLIVIVIGDEEIEHDTPLYNLILSKI